MLNMECNRYSKTFLTNKSIIFYIHSITYIKKTLFFLDFKIKDFQKGMKFRKLKDFIKLFNSMFQPELEAIFKFYELKWRKF